ncbi:hypothetical protein LIER_43372 [Lithospermum erythrorhizon]|uniref:Uncharacterized protein n=1 Tax=Lithospermum erythrorhizon TaxID=34254 RepID=A0AAV3Q2B3_LITER
MNTPMDFVQEDQNSANMQSVLAFIQLGHIHIDVLRKFATVKGVDGVNKMDVCYVCPLAKQQRIMFNKVAGHSTTLFDLIHINLWGFYREHTRQKTRDVRFYEEDFPFDPNFKESILVPTEPCEATNDLNVPVEFEFNEEFDDLILPNEPNDLDVSRAVGGPGDPGTGPEPARSTRSEYPSETGPDPVRIQEAIRYPDRDPISDPDR